MARVHCQHHTANILPWPSDSNRQLFSHNSKPSAAVWDLHDIELPSEEAWNGPLARCLSWGQTSGHALLQQVCRLPGDSYFSQPQIVAASPTVSLLSQIIC